MDLLQIKEILAYSIITISDRDITLGTVLLIPLVLLMGVLITRWLVKLLTNRLTSKKTDLQVASEHADLNFMSITAAAPHFKPTLQG